MRAFSPSCVAQFREQPIKVIETVPLFSPHDDALPEPYHSLLSTLKPSVPPGNVVTIVKDLGPVLQTGDGLLLLKTVQLAGKRKQSGHDLATEAKR